MVSCYDDAIWLSGMSSKPGVYHLPLQRRADDRTRLEFYDSNDDPINLTGWTVYASIWDKARTTKYADFDIEYVDRPNGVVNLFLSSEDSEGLPCECFYDVMLEDSLGFKEYYLEGNVYVSEGYTEP